MWPWLERAVVSTDNIQIDWLAARKEGLVGVALMNESPAAIETEIKLGAKVGANLTGYGTLYRVDGAQEKLYFENGKAKVTIPGRTLVGIKIRSEEHTSELQSLMRISYAVFCLKKKKKQ